MKEIKDEIKKHLNFWTHKIQTDNSFWISIALSYLAQDIELEKQQIFITQISFYPQLIDVLLSTLSKTNKKVSINILFF